MNYYKSFQFTIRQDSVHKMFREMQKHYLLKIKKLVFKRRSKIKSNRDEDCHQFNVLKSPRCLFSLFVYGLFSFVTRII